MNPKNPPESPEIRGGAKREIKPFEPIHGVTYIVDYYSVLELSQGATEQEIGKALRDKRIANHPDKLMTMDEELRSQAESK